MTFRCSTGLNGRDHLPHGKGKTLFLLPCTFLACLMQMLLRLIWLSLNGWGCSVLDNNMAHLSWHHKETHLCRALTLLLSHIYLYLLWSERLQYPVPTWGWFNVFCSFLGTGRHRWGESWRWLLEGAYQSQVPTPCVGITCIVATL